MDDLLLEQNLKCPICLSIPDDPCESSCCGHLFCSHCIENIKFLNCPICRSANADYKENSFVKNLISTLLTKCPYGCDSILTLDKIKIHRYKCQEAIFRCTIDDCKYEDTRLNIMKHIQVEHQEYISILAENFACLKSTFDRHTIFKKMNYLQIDDKILDENITRVKESLNKNSTKL